MQIFWLLLLKILPLYALIVLGYIAGKYLRVSKENIASLIIYIIAPVVFFSNIAKMELQPNLLLLPVIFYLLCSGLCLLFYTLGKKFWNDPTRNILAFTAGNGNTGYFGIPVALALFGEKSVGLMVLSILGYILYENTIGFFVTARGKHTAQESLKRLLRLPTLYAFIAALLLNLSGIKLGQDFFTFTANFTGAYSILGMMLIGLGLAAVKREEFDGKFIGLAFAAKFVLWPAIMLALIWVDTTIFHLFNDSIHHVMMLLAIVPLAANTIAYAAALDAKPAKAAAAVFLSTLVALVYIPVMVGILWH